MYCVVLQYIPRNMHTVFALLCFVVVKHWLIFPYPSGLLHWHCGNLTIAPVPAKQPWWIWINTSREFIMNDCITTTKQSTTKPCAYFLGYTVYCLQFTLKTWHAKPRGLSIWHWPQCLIIDPIQKKLSTEWNQPFTRQIYLKFCESSTSIFIVHGELNMPAKFPIIEFPIVQTDSTYTRFVI